jgi:transposase
MGLDNTTLSVLLNLPSIAVSSIEILNNRIIIKSHSILDEQLCPSCLSKISKVKSATLRQVRDLSLLGKEVHLELTSRQFYCDTCHRYFQERFSFVEENKQLTTRLEKYLYECCKSESLEKIAARENFQWNALQAIFIRYGSKDVDVVANILPTHIGIDEFAHKKGKKDYATVIVDLQKGIVLDVLDFRDKEQLLAYFTKKGLIYCQNVQVFSCDMWEGFSNVAKKIFPNADIVIDKFHFFSHINQAIDKERKRLRAKHKDEAAFKDIKWLLFKAWEKLTPKQKTLLLRAFRLAPTLKDIYFLKNELQNIFNTNLSKQKAEIICQEWIEKAKNINNECLNTFLKTFNNWKNDILNFFTHRVTNGIVEGLNNVIKTIKRQAYGFRNFDNFKIKIIVYFT